MTPTERLKERALRRVQTALDSMPPGGREAFLKADNDIALIHDLVKEIERLEVEVAKLKWSSG